MMTNAGGSKRDRVVIIIGAIVFFLVVLTVIIEMPRRGPVATSSPSGKTTGHSSPRPLLPAQSLAAEQDAVSSNAWTAFNPPPPPPENTFLPSAQVGFFVTVYSESDGIIDEMLRGIRRFMPESPIYMLNDNGPKDFSKNCARVGLCSYRKAATQLNVDRQRPPYNYTCHAQLYRIVEAIRYMKTRYAFLWESDARLMGRVRQPSHDLMQQALFRNRFTLWSNTGLPAYLDAHFRKNHQLAPSITGMCSTGGTIFDARKLVDAFDASHGLLVTDQAPDKCFKNLRKPWDNRNDETEDVCLFSAALCAGMTIGDWVDYAHPQDLYYFPRCKPCAQLCQSAKYYLIPGTETVESCMLEKCMSPICPPIWHFVKGTWADLSWNFVFLREGPPPPPPSPPG